MTGERRYSLPFFLTPDPDAMIEPLESCVVEEGEEEGEGKKFERINVGEMYVRRVLPARHKHPTAIKYRDTPEEEFVGMWRSGRRRETRDTRHIGRVSHV